MERTWNFEVAKNGMEFEHSVSAENVNEGRQHCIDTFNQIFEWELEPSEVIYTNDVANVDER